MVLLCQQLGTCFSRAAEGKVNLCRAGRARCRMAPSGETLLSVAGSPELLLNCEAWLILVSLPACQQLPNKSFLCAVQIITELSSPLLLTLPLSQPLLPGLCLCCLSLRLPASPDMLSHAACEESCVGQLLPGEQGHGGGCAVPPHSCPGGALPGSCLHLGSQHPMHPTLTVISHPPPPLQRHCQCWGKQVTVQIHRGVLGAGAGA